MVVDNIDNLQYKLNYTFKDKAWLQLALTHRSFSSSNNERLEFVGDGILDYVVAVNLYKLYPELSEGELSKIRAALVNQVTLSEIASFLNIGSFLLLGDGEEQSGGRFRESILADAMEAIFAAISFDSSLIEAQRAIEGLYLAKFNSVDQLVIKDSKSALQEYLQARKIDVPVYRVVQANGPAHNNVFNVECSIPQLHIYTTGIGKSKKLASQVAASQALQLIKENRTDGR